MTVETKEEDEESATGAQTSAEKMDVDEKVNSIFGGGAQAELGVVFTPEERGGNMGDVVTAEFIRFSSDDKINSRGSDCVGEETPPLSPIKMQLLLQQMIQYQVVAVVVAVWEKLST